MTILGLLNKLKNFNVRITVVNDNLKVIGDTKFLTHELLNEIRDNKTQIIDYLNSSALSSISKAPVKDYYPLSSAQRQIYILQQFNKNSTSYNLPFEIYLGNEININRIEETFRKIIDRHIPFRTCFRLINGEPFQVILTEVDFYVENLMNDSLPKSAVTRQFFRPFDLEKAPLLRVGLLQDNNGWIILVDTHHIINDGISIITLKKEFLQLYSDQNLMPVSLDYIDFSEWENSPPQQAKVLKAEEYWIKTFSGHLPSLELPLDFRRPEENHDKAARFGFGLDLEESNLLRTFAEQNALTLYMAVTALFSILLRRLTNQETIVVGVPVSVRTHLDIEDMVGNFTNILAIKIEVPENITLNEFVRNVRQAMLNGFENQRYPFEKLVERIAPERKAGRNPIFDVQINILNYGEVSSFERNHEENVHEPAVKRFDITLNIDNSPGTISMDFQYDIELFKAETIEDYASYFKSIIRSLGNGTNQPIANISCLTEHHKSLILKKCHGKKTELPDKRIHELFEFKAKNAPGKTALVFKEQHISYTELNEESNKIAHHLINSCLIEKGDIVAIITDRSPESVMLILAILKAGGAFLPIDIKLPINRINFIIKDAKAKLVISDKNLIIGLQAENELDIRDLLNLKGGGTLSPSVNVDSKDLCYVIYTSGSTGNPKGVAIQHDSLSNYIEWANRSYFDNAPGNNFPLFTSLAFDLTLTSIFTTLLRGDELHIFDSVAETDVVLEKIFSKGSKINALKMTPSHINLIDINTANLEHIKTLILGGELLDESHIEILRKLNPNMLIHNEYGPTEATIGCSAELITQIDENTIGKPIDNLNLYVLNSRMELQPFGVWGELYIGGRGVARGYLNNEDLNAKSFFNDPFEKNGIIYKSGDKGRMRSDGKVEFGGRLDEQIKLNGHRIELSEIEVILSKHKKVTQCAVVLIDTYNSKFLCAYIVIEDAYSVDEIRNYAGTMLPSYMVPTRFIEIDALPLTLNGKIDKKHLASLITDKQINIGPRNQIEERLVDIWSKVLNIRNEDIGINQTILELGGHSLNVIKILVRIRNEFQVNLNVEDVFKRPTIEAVAKIIQRKSWMVSNVRSDNEQNDLMIL